MHDREYNWSDLTTNSENELLKNEVCFEGSTFPLIELITVESQVTKFLPLAHFIHHTFAEYYVAEFLVKHLTKETRFLKDIMNISFKLLLGADYAVISCFLN